VFDQIGLGGGIATRELAEKILHLVSELVGFRADGQMVCGHDQPSKVLPGVRSDGREVGSHQRSFSAT
jgi:hypothetical protein